MIELPDDLAPESREIMLRGSELGLLDDEAETVQDVRAQSLGERQLMAAAPPVAGVTEREIAGPETRLRVRIYRPAGEPPFPTVLFIHGGGWVVGSIEHADVDCRCLCLDTGSVVISLDYRLAPEHPFPAGLEDAYAAVRWAAAEAADLGGDPQRLIVAGDSAGGNLAAAVCLLARLRGGPEICRQVLVYPVTDCAFDTESYRDFADGYWLTRGAMRWFWDLYLEHPSQGAHPMASVVRAPSLAGLPPATLVIAGCDVLRDEAEAYAERLLEAGVPTAVLRYPGQIHGFWSCGAVSDLPRAVNASLAGTFITTSRAPARR